MIEKINEYMNYKWMLAMIFMGDNFITTTAKENSEFEEQFFAYDSLSNIASILKGTEKTKVFDDDKLNNIRNAMQYYITKYSNKNNETIDLCKKILELTNNPKGKNIKNFYKLEYLVRNGAPCKKISPEIKKDIDNAIISDIGIINEIVNFINGENLDLRTNDIDFLKTINMIMFECPEMFYEPTFFEYIYDVLNENSNHTENETLQNLNTPLLEIISEIDEKQTNLNLQHMQQSLFSLIFSSSFDESLKLLAEEDKRDFFDSTVLEQLCNMIKINQETCMFDERRIKNIRDILLAFYDEKLLTNQQLNEMKVCLNVHMNNEYKRKNYEFYLKIFQKYYNRQITVINEVAFRNLIDTLIQETGVRIGELLDLSIHPSVVAKDEHISLYMNYLLDTYPLIRENSIYIERVKDILYYNENYLAISSNPQGMDKVNMKLQKKIKKLCKD